jgi:hypothetical protein
MEELVAASGDSYGKRRKHVRGVELTKMLLKKETRKEKEQELGPSPLAFWRNSARSTIKSWPCEGGPGQGGDQENAIVVIARDQSNSPRVSEAFTGVVLAIRRRTTSVEETALTSPKITSRKTVWLGCGA